MNEFYLTFGQQYRREFHPNFAKAHPDGYVLILADDENEARDIAFDRLGPAWSMLYSAEKWDHDRQAYFPLGELGVFTKDDRK